LGILQDSPGQFPALGDLLILALAVAEDSSGHYGQRGGAENLINSFAC
jgi:hypothetical protein